MTDEVGAEEMIDDNLNTDQLALTQEEKIQQLEEHNEYLRQRLIDQSGVANLLYVVACLQMPLILCSSKLL